ncbi:16S rRNA (uracil(1498)-N(3))-methyltransferase [Terrihabitans sp. B22-R8]|uniref:16S rRNA (uracil(1498)-N(3))-methyltransferase n=1 Tax=Terrihabitans sp. B22-R8 TaxID=3425128 RepID=UPI00403D418D
MAQYDFSAPRLFVEDDLTAQGSLTPPPEAQNYLRNVLRLGPGGSVLVFNGRDGEWLAIIEEAGKKRIDLRLDRQMRHQTPAGDLWYLFAPLKHARLDYMVQKTVEMGAARLWPVMTQRTQASRINLDRMRANAIEAAEQCGILTLPEIVDPQSLRSVLENWPDGRALIFCDENAESADPLPALQAVRTRPLAVLIGPEGGFDESERDRLLKLPSIVRLSLGPRILRADTAAVAALALVQAIVGDRDTTGT